MCTLAHPHIMAYNGHKNLFSKTNAALRCDIIQSPAPRLYVKGARDFLGGDHHLMEG